MGWVRLEILPWAKRPIGSRATGRPVLNEPIRRGDRLTDLFTRLASKYPWFGEMVCEGPGLNLSDHITVIRNEVTLEAVRELTTELEHGDTLTLVHTLADGANE